MTTRLPLTVGLVAASLITVSLLAACGEPVQRSRAQTVAAADLSACRARADEIYNKQNRGDVYRADTFVSDTRDSPFSTSGLPGITSNGLSGLYQHGNLVSSCVSSRGAGAAGIGSTGTGAVGVDPTGPASTTSVSPPASQ